MPQSFSKNLRRKMMKTCVSGIYSIIPTFNQNNKAEKNIINRTKDYDISQISTKKGLRRLSKSTKNAIIASLNAIDGMETYEKGKIGVFVGSMMSYIENTNEFLKPAYQKSAKYVSPLAFPNTVLNNISGWISIVLETTNINTTVTSGKTSGIDAIKIACDYIQFGVIEKAIVVMSEEITDIVLQCDLFRSMQYSEGSIAIVLEKECDEPICIINDIFSSNTEISDFKAFVSETIDKTGCPSIIYGSGNNDDSDLENLLENKDVDKENLYLKYGEGFALNSFFKIYEFLKDKGKKDVLVLETNDEGNKALLHLKKERV